MKLTTKGRYAVMAMADLALYRDNGPTSLSDISLRQNISLPYLEQIFIKLKEKNLVKSIRGAKGGYVLEKTPYEIKISNIISAVDEEQSLLQFSLNEACASADQLALAHSASSTSMHVKSKLMSGHM